jgi:cobalt/nickel transport system permease protein
VLGVLTIVVGGALSLVASSYPDGLEWSVDGVLRRGGTVQTERADAETSSEPRAIEARGGAYDAAAGVQNATALMPDYAFKDSDSAAGTSVAGLIGSAAAMLIALGAGVLVARVRRGGAR